MKNARHNYCSEIFRTVFLFNWDGENVPEYSVLRNCLRKYMQNGKNNAKLRMFSQPARPGWLKMMANDFDVEFRFYILTILLTEQIFTQTKKAEDFGFRHIQTIYQGDTSLYFRVSINE